MKILQKAKNNSGTAIVAVLVAMTFVGIVVAAMVRSTGGQARFAGSFGVVTDANLAVSNGMMATESYFERETNREDVESLLTEALISGGGSVFGESNNRHRIGASDQYFSSKINPLITSGSGADARFFAKFDIGGGTRQKGNPLREATAFYEVENVRTEGGNWPGFNTFYLGGKFNNSDAKFHVKGNATFAHTSGESHFNSSSTPIFDVDENGEGDVYFHGNVKIDKPNGGTEFRTKVYFENNVILNSAADNALFQNKVGIQGNIEAQGNIPFRDSVWVAGNIAKVGGQNDGLNITYGGIADKAVINYTDNLKKLWNGHNESCAIINNKCTHSNHADLELDSQGKHIQFVDNVVGIYADTGLGDIRNKMGMTTLDERREPEIVLPSAPKQFIGISDILNGIRNMPGNNNQTNITATNFDSYIKELRSNDNYRDNFYNDHLLVNWNTDIQFNNIETGLLNEKVIFNMNTGSNIPFNGRFFKSGDDASMLIYVSPGTTLNEFGTTGNFRGLIYIPEENSGEQKFRWSSDSEIEGAVLMKGTGNLQWNAGNGRTTITKNSAILGNFAGLIPGNGGTAIVQDNSSTPIGLRSIGVYFH